MFLYLFIYLFIKFIIKFYIYALLFKETGLRCTAQRAVPISSLRIIGAIFYIAPIIHRWDHSGGSISIWVANGNRVYLINSGKYKMPFDTIKVNRDGNPLISAIVETLTWWKPDEILSEVTVSQLNIYFCVWKPSTHFACKRTLKCDFNCACYKRQKSDKFLGGVYVLF